MNVVVDMVFAAVAVVAVPVLLVFALLRWGQSFPPFGRFAERRLSQVSPALGRWAARLLSEQDGSR